MKRCILLLTLCACAGEYGLNNDNKGNDYVTREVPVAITGPGAVGPLGAYLVLDGRESYDPDGAAADLDMVWTVLEQPDGAEPILTPSTDGTATISSETPGTYRVGLTVIDRHDLESEVAETAARFDAGDVTIELRWDTTADLDLHIVQNDGMYYSDDDCYYGNPRPDWGEEGIGVDDPTLNLDDTDGYGPESIVLPRPEAGSEFGLYVAYHHDQGIDDQRDVTPLTLAEITVTAGALDRHRGQATLDRVGDVWFVGVLDADTLWVDTWGSEVVLHKELGAPDVNKNTDPEP